MPNENKKDVIPMTIDAIKGSLGIDFQQSQLKIAEVRYHRAQSIVDQCVREIKPNQRTLTDRIDAVLCHRITGPIFLLITLFLVYELAIVQGYRLANIWTPLLVQSQSFLLRFFPAQGFVQDPMITSFFAWVIQGVFSVLVYIPIFVILFAIVAVMEDSGYMARVAFILDRLFRPFGLHGQSALPLILAGLYIGGCAIPGVMATRTIKDRHARLATILIIPLMNCMAKIPFFTLMVGLFFPGTMGLMMFLISTITIFLGLGFSRLLSRTLLRKVERAPFIMELPAYHLPSIRNVTMRVVERTWGFVKKVVTIIAFVMAILFFLLNIPGLGQQENQQFETRVQEIFSEFYHTAGLDNPYLAFVHTPDQVASYLSFLGRYQSLQSNDVSSFTSSHHQSLFLENPSFYLIASGGVIALPAQERDRIWENLQDATQLYQEYSAQGFPVTHLQKIIEPMIFLLIGRPLERRHEGLFDTQAFQTSRALRSLLNHRRMIRFDRNEVILTGSFLGSLGKVAEPITQWAGFDWRINVGLISAFAAKENVVATLGVLYRDMDQGMTTTPLHGAAMILFMILYPPCLATILTIAAQIGWKWAILATIYPIVTGFLIASLVFTFGRVLQWDGLSMFIVVYAVVATLTILSALIRKKKDFSQG